MKSVPKCTSRLCRGQRRSHKGSAKIPHGAQEQTPQAKLSSLYNIPAPTDAIPQVPFSHGLPSSSPPSSASQTDADPDALRMSDIFMPSKMPALSEPLQSPFAALSGGFPAPINSRTVVTGMNASFNSTTSRMVPQGDSVRTVTTSAHGTVGRTESSRSSTSTLPAVLSRGTGMHHSFYHVSSLLSVPNSAFTAQRSAQPSSEERNPLPSGIPGVGSSLIKPDAGLDVDVSEEALLGEEFSDSDYDPSEGQSCERRRSLRTRRAPSYRSPGGDADDKVTKERKKVGRPIAYKGDPNSPHLTEDERRRVKRRIANRESARRVRQKRQDLLGELQIKMQHIQHHNQQLVVHCREIEAQKNKILHQLSDLRDKWTTAAADNMRLQGELAALRKALEMNVRMMEVTNRAAAQKNSSWLATSDISN